MTYLPPAELSARWTANLTVISRNLMALSEAESTKIIRARIAGQVNGFTGVTRERALYAIHLLDDMLQQYALLAHVVDEAAELVRRGSIFRNYAERVEDLLTSESVILVQYKVEVKERSLLDDGNRVVRATPASVLEMMEKSFMEARDTLTAISEAMERIRTYATALREDIAQMQQQAKASGVTDIPSPPDILQGVDLALTDPLTVTSQLDEARTSIVRWRAQVQTAIAEQRAIQDALEHAQTAYRDLLDLVARSQAAYAEAQESIADAAGIVAPDHANALDALGDWLATLKRTASDGRLAAVRVGLGKWEQRYAEELTYAQRIHAANRAPLDERDELKGRYTALTAKVTALQQRRQTLTIAIATAASEAKVALDAQPFLLNVARRAVAAFEAAALSQK